MIAAMPGAAIVEALARGTGFVDLSSWRKIAVSGGGALEWLNDLVSADVADLGPGRARRSLLLSPTGGIRAEFTVAVPGGTFVILQDPRQPDPIDVSLAPYILSSDVAFQDRTSALALFAFPSRSSAPELPGTVSSTPSCTGRGVDVLALAEDHDRLLAAYSKTFALAGADELESWRASAGIPRLGVDALEGDLPQEAGLADAVSFDKGCYLGQEAVAKMKNLGHPRRVVVRLAADEPVASGEMVEAAGEQAGEITSVAAVTGRWWLLARVRWERRDGPFQTTGGVALSPVAHP